MAGGDVWGVADGEADHVALGLGIPDGLVRLAKTRQQQTQRLAASYDAVTSDPVVDHVPPVEDDAIGEPACVEVDPQAVVRLVPARRRRQLDEHPDDPPCRRRGTIAHPQRSRKL